jgi:uncharacterized membrane protein
MTQLMCRISTLWAVSASATTLRTAIFTVGHFFIDFYVITVITGASVGEATMASLIAPAINGCWYWILDRFWTQTHMDRETDASIAKKV